MCVSAFSVEVIDSVTTRSGRSWVVEFANVGNWGGFDARMDFADEERARLIATGVMVAHMGRYEDAVQYVNEAFEKAETAYRKQKGGHRLLIYVDEGVNDKLEELMARHDGGQNDVETVVAGSIDMMYAALVMNREEEK